VRSNHIQKNAVGTPVGAQDTNQSSKDWRPGFQDFGNDLSIEMPDSRSPAGSKVHLNKKRFY
jgi:hypothetical protein